MRVTSIATPAVAALLLATPGCGHYPAPIRSAGDIGATPSSEYMVVVVSLPLEDWPRLRKFTGLEHFRVSEEMAPQITDGHLEALSCLELPRLRQVSLAHCLHVTDDGLQALTRLPSIEGLQLIGTGITDRGMVTLATGFPKLRAINVAACRLVTEKGFLGLTRSKTITNVGLSLDPLSQVQIENIISTVANVTWWVIDDPHHRLDEAPLQALARSRKIMIQVCDENNVVRSISPAQPAGAANGSQPNRSETNRAPSTAGLDSG